MEIAQYGLAWRDHSILTTKAEPQRRLHLSLRGTLTFYYFFDLAVESFANFVEVIKQARRLLRVNANSHITETPSNVGIAPNQ